MKLTWKSYQLKLNQPFVLSYGSFDTRTAFIVQLSDGHLIGLGEATAISYYGWVEEEIKKALERLADEINKGVEVEEILTRKTLSPPVRNAIQCAYVDLLAQLKGQRIGDYYNVSNKMSDLISSITISGDGYDLLKRQIDQYDCPIYKIKMTGTSDDQKLKLIADHPEKLFRIDANAGWNIEWIKTNVEALNCSNIEFIEQPF